MKISIIIPCYNEALDIEKNSLKVFEYLKKQKYDFEILLVNDGSKDETEKVINKIDYVKPVSYSLNHGKGYAIKRGIEEASGDYIGFMDADLSTDLSAIEPALEFLKENDFVMGSRHMKGSNILVKQPLKRRLMTLACRIYVHVLFGFYKYKDTQCGFKFLTREAAQTIIKYQRVEKFAFDIEYLYIAKLHKMKIKEFPVTWKDDRGTTVRAFSAAFKFFGDALAVRKNRKYYVKK